MASVRVAVRVRPLDKGEKQLSSKVIIHLMGNTIFINKPLPATGDEVVDRRKAFSYDYSYDSTNRGSTTYASQERIFQDLGLDVLKAAFEGFNACVFAYGQTGSGKSYTMMGNINDKGITPRICEGLLSEMDRRSKSDGVSFCTEVSYMEIYNELVQDLLKDKTLTDDGKGLKVREHLVDGPYVENLSKHVVHNHSEMEDLITLGNTNRMTASTGMNKSSSRSHAIFTIGFKQAWVDADLPRETLSRIHLVDLAGSERVDATRATGTRLKEGANINKSLVTLGSVISALADPNVGGQSTKKKKQVFIPYRDSVLTWLLKDSLGGNSVTTMIATISPADVNYNETLSTLRYASRAKSIVNSPIVNEDGSMKVIRELQAEVARLRGLLAEANQVSCEESSSSVKVEEELHQNEEKAPTLTNEWTSKWGETRGIVQEETVALRREGSGVVLDCQLPHLIGTDVLGTRIVLYYLKEGQTLIGSDAALCSLGIVLHGPGLLAEHCVLENLAGVVTLFPRDGALCSVNGSVVTGPWQLTQGSVTQLGTGTVLLFSHPAEAAQLRDKPKNGLLSAFLLSLTDVSKSTENPSRVMRQNLSQTDVLAVETEESKVSAKTPMTAAATPGNHPNPHSCFEPEEDILPGGVSTRDGQEQEGDLCHQSGPELMSKWPRKAQSGAEVASYKEEEVRSGDASLQETSVLGPGDGCGTKPGGNTNKIQDVTADCCKGRPGSGGSSLSHASHLQSGAGTSSASVLPQTSRDSQPDQKHPTSQAAYCPPEKTSFKDQSGCSATNESGGSKVMSEVCATDAAAAAAAAAAAVVQSSGLGSLVSKVSWIVQDAGRLFWSPATVLQQVRKKGIQPVRACWSSYFLSLVKESKALSVVNNSQVLSRVKGTFASSLFSDDSIFSVLKDLPLVQQINMMIVQNLQLEEAAQMVEDIKGLQGLTSTQTLCKVEELPAESVVQIPQDARQLQEATPQSNDQASENLGAPWNKAGILFSRQTLIKFPPTLLKLQTLPLLDLMNTLQSSVSTLAEKILSLSWLSVAKCSHPKPRPALLVLAESGLYTLTADSGHLVLFHRLPLSQLKEVHISLAGLGLCLMGTTLESILGVYTHSQALTKELCCAILGILHPEDGRVRRHPLLHGDLMKMSLGGESHVPDLLLDVGLRICSQFEKSLADLVYLLHRGMDEDEVSLGQVHVLLYTTVGICLSLNDDAEDSVAQFFLTDTHLGLVQEDVVFYPAPCSSPISPSHPQFHDLTLRQCSDVRCVLVHDEDESGAVRLDVILANVRGRGHPESVTKAATPSARISNSSLHAEVWKLTFSRSSEAARLINHLSNV